MRVGCVFRVFAMYPDYFHRNHLFRPKLSIYLSSLPLSKKCICLCQFQCSIGLASVLMQKKTYKNMRELVKIQCLL